MGLMADLAATRVHVLLVAVPGRPMLHARAAAAVRSRGWLSVAAPADADLLLVCGPVEGELAAAVDRVWHQVPAPRARRVLEAAGGIAPALDSAVRVLGDDALQRRSLREQRARDEERAAQDADAHDGGAQDADAHDGGGHDMSMSMDGPAGIPLASGWDDDRDGLEMDVLRLRLGPVLADWPAGLVVDCVLSGDVVVEATARLLPAVGGAEAVDPDVAAFLSSCGRAAALLRLAGWTPPATRLERIVDAVLAGAPPRDRLPALERVATRILRSGLLRWSLAGIPGDLRARLLVILGDAERAANGEPPIDEPIDPEALAAALPGHGLAEARLMIAAAGPVPAREGAARA